MVGYWDTPRPAPGRLGETPGVHTGGRPTCSAAFQAAGARGRGAYLGSASFSRQP